MKTFRTRWYHVGLAVASLALASVGCTQNGGGSTSPGGSPTTSFKGSKLRIGLVTDKGGLGDQSFNDSANAGLKKAATDLGIDTKVVQSKEEADYKKNLTTLAGDKYDLVIGVGVLMTDAVKDVAASHPDVKFALVDGNVDLPNVECLNFKEEEGSFLAGALTGLVTKSNKVSFLGGMEIPLILKFESGYKAGVMTTNPKADVLRGYTNKWDDPSKGKEMADSQYNQGVDVIFAVAGACNKGVIEAVKTKGPGFWAIGVDSDQDYLGTADPKNPAPPGRVLTTMIKHVDTAVFTAIKSVQDGKFVSGHTTFGLAQDGVSLSDLKYSKDQIPPDALAKVEALKQMIVSGQVQVPSTLEQVKSFKPPAVPSVESSGSPAASASAAASP